MKITVEMQDWKAAEQEALIDGKSHTYACRCVVAQALKRHGLNVVHVGFEYVRTMDRKSYRLPTEVRSLIYKFDHWPITASVYGEPETFLPVSFELEL